MISFKSDFAVQAAKEQFSASNHIAPTDSPVPRNSSSPLSRPTDRLIAIAGRPLSDGQQRDETDASLGSHTIQRSNASSNKSAEKMHCANSEIAGLKGLRLKRLQSMKWLCNPQRVGRNLEVMPPR